MEIEALITEMQELKNLHDNLTIDQILKIFEIRATVNLINKIEHLRTSIK